MLWFALILVSLEHWKQLNTSTQYQQHVVICSHFSIFGTLETTPRQKRRKPRKLWFALILVSLEHWKQREVHGRLETLVVICSHFSIFGTLETTSWRKPLSHSWLWFALILVSLEHWKQRWVATNVWRLVVICSHFSIFGTLETTDYQQQSNIHIVT